MDLDSVTVGIFHAQLQHNWCLGIFGFSRCVTMCGYVRGSRLNDTTAVKPNHC